MEGRKLVLFGVGDFARIARVYLDADSPHEVVAFTVDERYIDAPTLEGLPVVPFETLTETYPPGEYAMFVAVGFKKVNRLRAEMVARCREAGYELITYVCSNVFRVPGVTLGENCFVFENNVLQPGVTLGDDVILWSGNHIGHDVTLGDHCFVSSHVVISGHTSIGPYCFLGVNATIRNNLTVGEGTVVGMGAVITEDVEPHGIMTTKPARRSSRSALDLDDL